MFGAPAPLIERQRTLRVDLPLESIQEGAASRRGMSGGVLDLGVQCMGSHPSA
jgi:hypothetical protein